MLEDPSYIIQLRLRVPNRRTANALGVPVRWGVPIPRGQLRHASEARILDGNVGTRLAVIPRAYWDDKSIRWLLLHGVVRLDSSSQTEYCFRVEIRDSTENAGLSQMNSTAPQNTGRVSLRAAEDRLLIGPPEGPLACSVYLSGQKGEVGHAQIQDISTLIVNDAVHEFSGRAVFRGRPKLHCLLSGTYYPSVAMLKLEVTLRNASRARHRRGLWDLGDPGSFYFREFGLELHLPALPESWWWCHNIGAELRRWPLTPAQQGAHTVGAQRPPAPLWSIYQASSGGQNWNSRNHVNRHGEVTLPFKGYRLRFDGCEEHGDRASPVCCASFGKTFLGVYLPFFWQEFPRRIDLDSRCIRLALISMQPGDVHELQGGEQKTFVIWLAMGGSNPEVVIETLEATACASVEAVGDFRDWPELPAPLPDKKVLSSSRLASFVEESAFGADGLITNRELIDEYGWRHFGDVYADHEAAFFQGTPPLISHYNNQFDLLLGCVLHRWITGDTRYDELVIPLARHVIDIDIYHTLEDRASFNNALFWMTDHYKTAHTATHRAFSRFNAADAAYGGGPCAEHNYTTGLLMYYFLWGDDKAKEAVLGLANWVLAMDDGRQTPLFLLDAGPTGLATNTSTADYHGPGRGAANSINALIDAFLVSGQHTYLQAAERLIRRTVHPKDDLDGLHLDDPESRWSYTMYLESLAKFIRVKAMFHLVDEMYSYAISCLLHYARWMVQNENLYLKQPEKLKYPTEAWAAQEFRKATVFYVASALSEGNEKKLFRDKARWFESKAWEELLGFERPHNARVTAITMSQGLWHLGLASGDWQSPQPCGDLWRAKWPNRESFIPQKVRVRRLLRTPKGWAKLLCGLVYPPTLVRFIRLLWQWRN